MYARTDGWLAALVGDELVMMSAESGVYLGLNEVGARIWAIIETPRTLPDICTALAAEFQTTPQACQPQVEAFLNDLATRGAVSVTG
ncbi:MAG TPA: PqqD family peptide modification chaperone [Caulobacteraceae bacterium]|jgi:hypothetical protein|nr:PqqD family peptide modification chaperone [Caulobacteraceae bacterium]